MKKKICIIISVCAVIFLLLFLCIRASLRYGYIEGRVLIADNGAYFIVLNDYSPIRMTDCSWTGGLFADLQSGDRIAVIHGSIQESYPGKTDVYYLRRYEEGTKEDVFPEVIHILTELGWFKK